MWVINDFIVSEQDIQNEINRVKEILETMPPEDKTMKRIYEDYILLLQLILNSQ